MSSLPGRCWNEKTGRSEGPSRLHCEEPAPGLEPGTARLRIECSTTELSWRARADNRDAPPPYPVLSNALERTRTAMPFGTTPSRWRVYQFHHQGVAAADGAHRAHILTFVFDCRVFAVRTNERG